MTYSEAKKRTTYSEAKKRTVASDFLDWCYLYKLEQSAKLFAAYSEARLQGRLEVTTNKELQK